MRKVILQEFVTLDGMAAGPDGNTDFVPGSMQGDRSFMEEQMRLMKVVDTLLLGRKTYEMFASYWPQVKEGDDKEFAEKIGQMHKFVFSNTIESAPWGDQEAGVVVNGDATKELVKIKAKPGKNMIIWGSISLSQDLINEGLIDEYRLVTCPVVLGSGRPFFDDKVDSSNVKFLEAKTFDRGAVQLKYEPAKTVAKQTAG